MTILAEEEKVREEKKLLEMLWKMGEAHRCWNEAGGVGGARVMGWTRYSIFGMKMDWVVGPNRTVDKFAGTIRVASVGLNMEK